MTPGCWPTAPARRVVKTGGNTWFFLTADYAFGHALERDTAAVVERPAARCSARCATRSTPTTSRPSCCRRRLEGQDHRPRQCRRRHHQRDQAGRRVRHRQGRAEVRRPLGVRQRRQRARPADRAGPDPDQHLVLGHERRHPRLDQALAGRTQRARQVPDHGAGRRLFRPSRITSRRSPRSRAPPTARPWSPR